MAKLTQGASGRDILNICKNVERKMISKIVRKETDSLYPDAEMYVSSITERLKTQLDPL